MKTNVKFENAGDSFVNFALESKKNDEKMRKTIKDGDCSQEWSKNQTNMEK